jgi:type 2 lantibiotic biosynthesis protein LanM
MNPASRNPASLDPSPSSPASLPPDWFRALDAAERAAALAASPSPPSDPARAAKPLARWRAQPPFDQIGLASRLAAEGLDEAAFTAALALSPEELRQRSAPTPAWIAELEAALAAPPPAEPSRLLPPERGEAALLAVARPLVERAGERLRRRAREIAERRGGDVPFDPETAAELLAADLPGRLLTQLGRTLILELHVARVEERLAGATPEARFASFVAGLRDPARARALWLEYPVLARRVVETLERWVDTGAELLAHLAEDGEAVAATFFSGAPLGRVVEIGGSAGDVHRGGRSVRILRFEDGRRVVYKPRPLAVDVLFQELLAWAEARGAPLPLRRLAVLDRGGHGWIEFVEAAPCSTPREVERFHRRLGFLLALLYALEATDCHFENLIAAGEHPVLVDLESLFHPRVPPPPSLQPDLRLAARDLGRSVLRVGLLPFRIGEGEGQAGVDLSALASVEGELTPDPVLQFEAVGTDEMHAVRRRLEMPGAANRPRLGGRAVDALEQAGEVERGFTEGYRLLAAHRGELAAPGGPLEGFAAAPVRAVLRATRGYHLLAFESFHPDLLRDGLDRDRFLDRLWVGLDERPHLARTVAAERRDLAAGDIPLFTCTPGGTNLATSRGEEIPGLFEAPALDEVRRRLAGLGEEDLRRQTWLLRTSLATLALGRNTVPWPSYTPDPRAAAEDEPEEPEEDLRRRLLAAAGRVGERLESLALAGGEHATWVGLEYAHGRWSLVPLGEDLYGGSPGVVLFLAWLGELTGAERWTALARRGLTTLTARLEETAPSVRTLGAFQGWGGLLYLFTHLAVLWRRPGLAAAAGQAMERMARLAPEDRDYDVIGGAAGGIGALLACHGAGVVERALEVAVGLGDGLLAAARPVAGGLGWPSRVPAALPHTGFSHGSAGIGWALAELAAACAEVGRDGERFAEAARGAFRYEASRFAPELGNWLDPDDPDTAGRPREGGARATSAAWCYGAPGIGLARLAALARGQAEVEEDVRTALATTRRRGLGFNHSLCHGDLGNLELLLSASRRLLGVRHLSGGVRHLDAAVRRGARVVLASLERDGFLCGTPAAAESPGLMNGLAGIGWGLLRLAVPGRMPSVLTLDGPGREGRP